MFFCQLEQDRVHLYDILFVFFMNDVMETYLVFKSAIAAKRYNRSSKYRVKSYKFPHHIYTYNMGQTYNASHRRTADGSVSYRKIMIAMQETS